MASSSTTPPTSNNQANTLNNETALYEYMRQFVDYQENGVVLNEVSQIRQLDIYLQSMKSLSHQPIVTELELKFKFPAELNRIERNIHFLFC